jgi:hypothetical protein
VQGARCSIWSRALWRSATAIQTVGSKKWDGFLLAIVD